jgi:hypothetical protein
MIYYRDGHDYRFSFSRTQGTFLVSLQYPLYRGLTTSMFMVCQWLAAGQWFSMGTLVSSINKTDCHDIAEILLKFALNIIIITLSFQDEFWDETHLEKTIHSGYEMKLILKRQFIQHMRWNSSWKDNSFSTYDETHLEKTIHSAHEMKLILKRQGYNYDV